MDNEFQTEVEETPRQRAEAELAHVRRLFERGLVAPALMRLLQDRADEEFYKELAAGLGR